MIVSDRRAVYAIRDGVIHATVWLRDGPAGGEYEITLGRAYPLGDFAWRYSSGFGEHDAEPLVRVMERAAGFIREVETEGESQSDSCCGCGLPATSLDDGNGLCSSCRGLWLKWIAGAHLYRAGRTTYEDDEPYRRFIKSLLHDFDPTAAKKLKLPNAVKQAVEQLVRHFWRAQIDALGLVAPEYEPGSAFMAFHVIRWWLDTVLARESQNTAQQPPTVGPADRARLETYRVVDGWNEHLEPPSLPRSIRASLEQVIGYLWVDESRDFDFRLPEPGQGHIFPALCRLAWWLSGLPDDEPPMTDETLGTEQASSKTRPTRKSLTIDHTRVHLRCKLPAIETRVIAFLTET